MSERSERTSGRGATVRVGTDLVRIADVSDSIDRFGDRYLRRVYSDGEIAACTGADGQPDASRLAARFAAKEAVIKALRHAGPVPYTDIETVHDAVGAPVVRLAGGIAGAAGELGVASADVSITHDGDYAGAVYVALLDQIAPHAPVSPPDHTEESNP